MEIYFTAGVHCGYRLIRAELQDLEANGSVVNIFSDGISYSHISIFLNDKSYATALVAAINQAREDWQHNRQEDDPNLPEAKEEIPF